MIARTHLQLEVRYSAPARDCRRMLRILPRTDGGQIIRVEQLHISPAPDAQTEQLDRFGNRRLLVFHRALNGFQLELQLEAFVDEAPRFVDEGNLGVWKMPSRAVRFAPEFGAIAREMRALKPLERAQAICDECFQSLEYQSRTNDSPLDASAIWNRKRGNCADFAHVFLALCRMSGLPACYVAGFSSGQGQMHAWAEVFVDRSWRAFDPTHGRAPALGNVIVAVGRDFYDTMPTRATFRGDGTAQLALFCRTDVDQSA